jgi:hypothetical protein
LETLKTIILVLYSLHFWKSHFPYVEYQCSKNKSVKFMNVFVELFPLMRTLVVQREAVSDVMAEESTNLNVMSTA